MICSFRQAMHCVLLSFQYNLHFMNKRRVGPVNYAIDSHYCMSKCFRHVNQHNYLVDFRIFLDSQRLKGCRLRTELISKGFKQDQYTLVSWNLVQQIYFHLTAVLIVDENLGRKKRIHYCPTIDHNNWYICINSFHFSWKNDINHPWIQL